MQCLPNVRSPVQIYLGKSSLFMASREDSYPRWGPIRREENGNVLIKVLTVGEAGGKGPLFLRII